MHPSPGPRLYRPNRPDTPPAGTDADTAQHAERNRLLRAIPPAEYAWLLARLETVTFRNGEVLVGRDEVYSHVYFPQTCVVSQINRMNDGNTVEVGTIGNEGMVGLSVFLDAGATPSDTIVQVPGASHRVSAEIFLTGAHERPELHRLLHRYTLAFLTQVAQTASCNRAHTLEERCARWLLMTHDRVGSDTFLLTHEFLSYMLGVRRSGVSVVAATFQKAGLIHYARGKITVLDRQRLEGASCQCYRVVQTHFDRLFSSATA